MQAAALLIIVAVCVRTLPVVTLDMGGFSVIDLSHSLDKNSLKWPTGSDFSFTILTRGMQANNSYWYETNKFETPEHIGTHLDAPAHFYNNSWRVDDIPVERLVGPGVVIDIRDKVVGNSDYRLVTSDLQIWESVHGPIPQGAIVLMRSGWESRYQNKSLTFNTATPDNPVTYHFPGFHPEAVTWLISKRNIGMIDVDTPSTDYGQSVHFEVHQILGKANVMGLENVNNLGHIPASGSIVIAAPIKLHGASGVPIRLLALVDHSLITSRTVSNAGSIFKPFWCFW